MKIGILNLNMISASIIGVSTIPHAKFLRKNVQFRKKFAEYAVNFAHFLQMFSSAENPNLTK